MHQTRLVGAAIFSVPIQVKAAASYGAGQAASCDLGRFLLLDHVGGNAETWFLARALRLLRQSSAADSQSDTPQLVIAYSDPPFVRDPSAITHTLIIKPFGKKYGLAVRSISTLDDIKQAVAWFGGTIVQRFPEHSFSVTIRFRGGDVPPEGYDEALQSGQLGQNRYAQFFDACSTKCLTQDSFGRHRGSLESDRVELRNK